MTNKLFYRHKNIRSSFISYKKIFFLRYKISYLDFYIKNMVFKTKYQIWIFITYLIRIFTIKILD